MLAHKRQLRMNGARASLLVMLACYWMTKHGQSPWAVGRQHKSIRQKLCEGTFDLSVGCSNQRCGWRRGDVRVCCEERGMGS
mmetsp:Transcript_20908/g.45695  ORF Transcript_20908/g.45695 Transcript_20908/m.45695 type:complete len:82 (-) Transcript_20908:1920-2165(-)